MCVAQFAVAFQLNGRGDHSNEEQTMKKLVLVAALVAAISSSASAQSATRAFAAPNPSNPLNTQTLRQTATQPRPFASDRRGVISGAQWWQDRGNTEEDVGEIYHR
jgi:hypothetical protein